jgi:hypothetical protein
MNIKSLLQKEKEKFFKELLKRKRFNYSLGDIFKNMFRFFCCFKDDKLKKRRLLFQKASKKLNKELDCITLLKTIR